MKFFTTLLAVLFSMSLFAQTDIFDMFDGMYDEINVPTNINKIVETEYTTSTFDEEAKPINTMKHGEETLDLFFSSKTETVYEDSKNYSEIGYDKDGKKTITMTFKMNDLGQMILWDTNAGDGPAAAYMNSKKEFTYDVKGRLTSVMNKGKEAAVIKYDKKGNMDQLSLDAGFAKMKIVSSIKGNVTRYDMEVDQESIPAGMPEMMLKSLNDAPKEYIEQTPGNKKNSFVGYKENKETGEFEKIWETVRNLKYKVLSKKEFNSDGEVTTHNEFEYTETGDIKSTKNIKEGTTMINEFNDKGNITVEKQPFGKTLSSYDEKGNLIKSISLVGEGEDFSVHSVKLREIDYK